MNPEQLRQMIGVDRLPMFENPDALREAMRRHYPAALQKAGIGGSALVEVHVAADGTVEGVDVVPRPTEVQAAMVLLKADGTTRPVEVNDDPVFGPVARAALMEMRFTPAMRDGQPVPFTLRMTISFDPRAKG